MQIPVKDNTMLPEELVSLSFGRILFKKGCKYPLCRQLPPRGTSTSPFRESGALWLNREDAVEVAEGQF